MHESDLHLEYAGSIPEATRRRAHRAALALGTAAGDAFTFRLMDSDMTGELTERDY